MQKSKGFRSKIVKNRIRYG